ncbi:S8 family serine peptidase [Corallococcus sicarius]|uniref:Peptidase S8/S53 subtilisin kexin sedolisin n=1 Tax=Corallococcus sicarius TaxID=2316726 RepID=A0A3A8NAP9_9BACT|nr:S8 family serine peptidase [Corallococcus sicarius]RKH38235.1 peptidase S8/S53 subtilisin kexin sedolisin [Corallococcus sicarius]
MLAKQTRDGRTLAAKTRHLPLIGMLALSLGGCSAPGSQDAEAPPEQLMSRVAPLNKAPAGLAIGGEYIVVFGAEVGTTEIDTAVADVIQAGGANSVMHQYGIIPGFSAKLDATELGKLLTNPAVAYIEENAVASINTVSPSPADGTDRVDQRLGRNGSYDDHGRTGAGVHLYVLDTGINTRHTEFAGRIGNGFGAIADGRGVEDCHGHGTHVSSTAAGTQYGMAKQARIHPVRVLNCFGSGTWEGVLAGVDFVRADCANQNGPCVANMSLGGGLSNALNTAVANAVNAGVTFVVAAGNESTDACTRSPASTPAAITVAATDDADRRASFSNYGNCVDIFAPGVSILGAWVGSTTATNSIEGTSMASPHVAGAAAQYLTDHRTARPHQVEANIEGSASLECVKDVRGSPNAFLFSDLNQGNYTCNNAVASCRGLCGGPGYGCFCEESCVRYGDCCPDYAEACE